MKDYTKIFKDENKQTFDHQKMIQEKIDKCNKKIIILTAILISITIFFLLYFNYSWNFIGFEWTWSMNVKNDDEISILKFIITVFGPMILALLGMVLYGILGVIINRSEQKVINIDQNILKANSKAFASSVYLDDILSALKTVFTLDSTFVDTFRKIMPEFEWFNYDQFNPWGKDVTNYYDNEGNTIYIEEKLIIKHEGSKYQLKSWEHEKNEFRFFFEKINSNGLVEKDVEFLLPVTD